MEKVAAALTRLKFQEGDIYGVRLALEEALSNAIRHGNQGDTNKHVTVRYQVNAQRILIEVEDQGAGFNPESVPDPTSPERLEQPGGRGLLIMRHYTTWMRFNERGNAVTLCKSRSERSAR